LVRRRITALSIGREQLRSKLWCDFNRE